MQNILLGLTDPNLNYFQTDIYDELSDAEIACAIRTAGEQGWKHFQIFSDAVVARRHTYVFLVNVAEHPCNFGLESARAAVAFVNQLRLTKAEIWVKGPKINDRAASVLITGLLSRQLDTARLSIRDSRVTDATAELLARHLHYFRKVTLISPLVTRRGWFKLMLTRWFDKRCKRMGLLIPKFHYWRDVRVEVLRLCAFATATLERGEATPLKRFLRRDGDTAIVTRVRDWFMEI